VTVCACFSCDLESFKKGIWSFIIHFVSCNW
jgi:hypothetical protein